MWIRLFFTAIAIGGVVWFLSQEQARGRFRQVDEVFEDFLIANARSRWEIPPGAEIKDLILLEFREDQANEFDAWPPQPLDWQIVLEALKPYQPQVLVIAEPLSWGIGKPEFIGPLGETLRDFPSVILSVEAEMQSEPSDAPPFLGGLDRSLPDYPRIAGVCPAETPILNVLTTAPEPHLRAMGEIGLIAPAASPFPFVIRCPQSPTLDCWFPSLAAQAITRLSRTPYGGQRLRLGVGAGVHYRDGRFVPLLPGGGLMVASDSPHFRTLNALDLMTGSLVDPLTNEDRQALSQASVVMVGITRSQRDHTLREARAIATVLAMPLVHTLSPAFQWTIWIISAFLALWIVTSRRGKSGWVLTAILIFAGVTVSYLAFESTLTWCPPTIPVAILAVGGSLSMLIGKPRKTVAIKATLINPPNPSDKNRETPDGRPGV